MSPEARDLVRFFVAFLALAAVLIPLFVWTTGRLDDALRDMFGRR